MSVIIIESPNKVEKIKHYSKAKVYATKGHFKTLTKQIVKDYKSYEPIFDYKDNKAKFNINEIIKECKNEDVIIATDPDREGYAIGYMFYELVKNTAKSVKRAEFHEITQSGIEQGLSRAVAFANSNLKEFEAFKARAVGDKLVGFILSPQYIKKLEDKNISVGRVQTPALSIIVKRELEISDFLNSSKAKQIDYKIKAKLKAKGVEFFATNDNLFTSKEQAEEKIKELKSQSKAKVYEIKTTQSQIKPKEPFRTSQLQEQANIKYGFSPDKTMNLAQSIFEKGLITYHRTDSNMISDGFIDQVDKEYGDREWYEKRIYQAGEQSQASAHEAIRIARVHRWEDIEQIAQDEKLSDDEMAFYKLIFQNSILSQAKNAINESTTYDIDITTLSFKAKNTKNIYKGFKGVFETEEQEESKEENTPNLDINKGDELEILGFELQEVKKQAPKRYKESNFIPLLEKEGIGRPSTYASFLKKLLDREFIEIKTEKKNNFIYATQKGINFLQSIQSENEWITQSQFTKQMEAILDKITSNEVGYLDFIKPLHEKMGFTTLDKKEGTPPSDKQLKWAKDVAQELNLKLPDEAQTDWRVCKEFIENNAKKIKKEAKAPSEKQIKFAQDLAGQKGMELPKGYDLDYKICTEFINKAKEKK